jgi:hypothetical protein
MSAIRKKEKEFSLFTDTHKKKYKAMESKLEALCTVVSNISEFFHHSSKPTQSSAYIPNFSVGSCHYVPSMMKEETTSMQPPCLPLQKSDPGAASTSVSVERAIHSAELIEQSQVGMKGEAPSGPVFM